MPKLKTARCLVATTAFFTILLIGAATKAKAQNGIYDSGPGGTPPLIYQMMNQEQQPSPNPQPAPFSDYHYDRVEPPQVRSYVPEPIVPPQSDNRSPFPDPYPPPSPY